MTFITDVIRPKEVYDIDFKENLSQRTDKVYRSYAGGENGNFDKSENRGF